MSQQSHIIEIPGLFSNKISRRLIFEVDGITIEKPFGFDAIEYIPAENFAAIRMGIRWPKMMRLVNGRRFIIELKLYNGNIVRIKLDSICNLRAQSYDEIWTQAVKYFYNYYFSSQLNLYIELFHLKQTFNISNIRFMPEGICMDDDDLIYWNDLSMNSYQSHFTVHHRKNVYISKSFSFLNVWNAHILQAMIKYAVEDHQRMLSE